MRVIAIIMFYSVLLITLCFIDGGGKCHSLLHNKKTGRGLWEFERVSGEQILAFEFHTGESETRYFKRSVHTHIYTYGLLNIVRLEN